MGTCTSERLENVSRVNSAQWQPHLLNCTAHLTVSQALALSQLGTEAKAYLSPDPTARVGKTEGRDLTLGAGVCFLGFLVSSSIWYSQLAIAHHIHTVLGKLKASPPYILTLE